MFEFSLKMMPSWKEKFLYPFFITCLNINEFSYFFITPLSLSVMLFSRSPYLTSHLKINYKTGRIEMCSEKAQAFIQDQATKPLDICVHYSAFTTLTQFSNTLLFSLFFKRVGDIQLLSKISFVYIKILLFIVKT